MQKQKTLNVEDMEFDVDKNYLASWAFMESLRKLNDKDADAFEKLDVSFAVIDGATGVTKEQIIDACGGETAPASDVIALVAQIIKAVTPKN